MNRHTPTPTDDALIYHRVESYAVEHNLGPGTLCLPADDDTDDREYLRTVAAPGPLLEAWRNDPDATLIGGADGDLTLMRPLPGQRWVLYTYREQR